MATTGPSATDVTFTGVPALSFTPYINDPSVPSMSFQKQKDAVLAGKGREWSKETERKK
ncbi:hypothetical protein FACS189472_17420 [Alphaproteobacteria bacterium]|nr:hypothetical protein FACS189472_17420 [Alphaproteobacteria bacterium]